MKQRYRKREEYRDKEKERDREREGKREREIARYKGKERDVRTLIDILFLFLFFL